MKTISEIKDEVAEGAGYKNWDLFMYTFAGFGAHVQPYNDEVAKRYAEAALKESIEKVTMIIERGGKVLSSDQIGWIAEDGDHSEVNKQSILNIIKELK